MTSMIKNLFKMIQSSSSDEVNTTSSEVVSSSSAVALSDGNTVLHKHCNDLESLKRLLERSTDNHCYINAMNNRGETPLHLCNVVECVQLLLGKGANPNIKDVNSICGNTAFTTQTNPQCMKLMLQIFMNCRGADGRTTLHDITNVECAKVLFETVTISAIDLLSMRDLMGNTPFHTCSDPDILKLFIEKLIEDSHVEEMIPIDINNATMDLVIAGSKVNWKASEKAVELLLSKNNEKRNILHQCTTYKGAVAIFDAIPEHFHKLVNEIDVNGQTPLFNKVDQEKLLEFMLEKGANPCIVDLLGRRPLDYTEKEMNKVLLMSVMDSGVFNQQIEVVNNDEQVITNSNESNTLLDLID